MLTVKCTDFLSFTVFLSFLEGYRVLAACLYFTVSSLVFINCFSGGLSALFTHSIVLLFSHLIFLSILLTKFLLDLSFILEVIFVTLFSSSSFFRPFIRETCPNRSFNCTLSDCFVRSLKTFASLISSNSFNICVLIVNLSQGICLLSYCLSVSLPHSLSLSGLCLAVLLGVCGGSSLWSSFHPTLPIWLLSWLWRGWSHL